MNGKILIADDELRIRRLVGDFLKKEGYNIIEAKDGQEALNILNQQKCDLVILDIMMPKYDGWSVCREIKKELDIPVIMLTARSEESDELFGFNLGADDYISKPFSPKILIARVKALLKRVNNCGDIMLFNGLKINKIAHQVYINDIPLDLSPKEFELLVYLAENEGKAVSREQILNTVWNYDFFGDARTVDTHIKKLRMKLEDKGDYIQTIRGLGYRFEV